MDRGFASLELMAWMKELNINFVQRINKEFYKAEINRIKDNDSPINIKLNASRLRGFKDSELKEKYRKESYLNLRLVTVELESGEIERLLTNIPPEYNVNRGHLSYLWSEMDNRNKLQYFKKQV